ncbi:MAG: ATP-binding protein, partial [Gemmatimonadales bacterium]
RESALHGRELELTRAEAEGLDRRLSFFSQASVTLSASLDYEIMLRDLARLIVPTMADWCTIHVANDRGALQFVAGAHRDPSRDLVVRALCEYGNRSLPFRDAGAAIEAAEVDDEALRQRADDLEHLKLYRSLAPTSYLQLPLTARGRAAGMITLVAGREYGRRFHAEDIEFAQQLGNRAALAVDNGRLRREAEEADRRYRLLFEANPQPMWVFEVDTLAFLAVNQAAIRHYGYSRDEFQSMTIMDIRPPDDSPGLAPGLEHGSHREEVALTQHQRKDGTVVDMELTSHELELDGRRARLVLATDISERTRTRVALHESEEQLRRVQRLDAVGRLASAVAHDFNNVLTTIRGFSDMLHRDLGSNERHRAEVEQIRKAADRGALLTRQLLAFGRKQSVQRQTLNLNEVVGQMEGLIQRLVGADVQLELRLAPDLGAIHIDPGHLEQMLVNLLLNARDAMPSGGTLTIETAERQIAGAARRRHVRPGRYVVLAVSDTGPGMDQETLSHLFEPFAAPTPVGQRAGLGRAIVYSMVRQNGGVVRVSSEPGQGTTVKVYLPRVEQEDPVEVEPDFSLRGDETVLVVEDEEGVRELLHKILQDRGHTVIEARHGRDAVMLAERYERPIHLLVTDVVMPGMGVQELVERLTGRRPELKVLYISGYTNDEIVHRGVRRTGPAFIQKPFTADELMRKVRGVLASTEPSASSS